MTREHCKDCCCARAWEALEVTSYTGMSIVEHIEQLREQLATMTQERDEADILTELEKYPDEGLWLEFKSWCREQAMKKL